MIRKNTLFLAIALLITSKITLGMGVDPFECDYYPKRSTPHSSEKLWKYATLLETDKVKKLLAQGVCQNEKDEALDYLILSLPTNKEDFKKKNARNIMHILLKAGANPNTETQGDTLEAVLSNPKTYRLPSLYKAATNGDADTALMLLEAGASYNFHGTNAAQVAKDAFHYACAEVIMMWKLRTEAKQPQQVSRSLSESSWFNPELYPKE